jgi:hypothetical protein
MYLPPAGDSRRGFLKKGLLGGAILALGGGGALALQGGKEIALPPEGLLSLSAREYAVVVAVAARLMPISGDFPPQDLIRVGFNADRILTKVDATALTEMKQLLNLFENALPNFLFGLRVRPFTQMGAEEQDQTLKEWMNSKLILRRSGFTALRGLALAAYFVKPETWAATGYPGPPKGFHDPNAPVWKGGGAPRPPSPGIWVEPT